jgi:hypothetical protein
MEEVAPTAQVYFRPPQGDGVIFTMEFGAAEQNEWKTYRAEEVPYFLLKNAS